ncbi:MAG: hypothetical protein K2W95_21760 [Candidatus Obscuribacterales bacterium]|nr:hypothetical protein [Candidatus Obscuribacterales bacterium]
MSWPTPQDFNEALQSPHISFVDAQLRDGQVSLDQLGLPRPITGAFASVYRVKSRDGKDWAVRCFLHSIRDQNTRYAALSHFICNDTLDFTTPFQFLERGISIRNEWFPLLKMTWVEGLPLDIHVRQNIQNEERIRQLANQFSDMVSQMQAEGIAHGDLQHGNILVTRSGLALVDYDGMYVPSLKGLQSNELGHRNYQHPARSAEDFGPTLDNFSAHVIINSLNIIASAPEQLNMENEGLIFSREDFLEPDESETFHALESHSDSRVVEAAKNVRALLNLNHMALPGLNEEYVRAEIAPLKPLKKKREPPAKLARIKTNEAEPALFEKSHPWYTASHPALQAQSQSSPFQMQLGSEFGYTHLHREWEEIKVICNRTNAEEAEAAFLIGLIVTFNVALTFLPVLGWAVIVLASLLLVAGLTCVRHNGFRKSNAAKQRLMEAKERLKLGNPCKVLYYIVDRSGVGRPGTINITTYWLPPSLLRPIPIYNWDKLTAAERQALPIGSRGHASGDLYYVNENNTPIALVTNEGLTLWLTDFGKGTLVPSWIAQRERSKR